MKKNEKPSTASVSSTQTDHVGKPSAASQAKDESASSNDLGQGIDRPGFDLGGSSGDTHAGTGLGLGNDAFETPGDRRLPGRRLDNKLTIPRWSGPEPRDRAAPDKKAASAKHPLRQRQNKHADGATPRWASGRNLVSGTKTEALSPLKMN
jgi:hypothetical protein